MRVIVTDVLSAGGRELRRSRGPEAQAVMAAWQPRECLSVDGGVSDNTPISHAIELGGDEIYVLPTGYACALRESPRGALPMLLHATSLLVQQRLLSDIERYSERARLIVLPPPCPQSVEPTDFSRADELIEGALAASRSFLRSSGDIGARRSNAVLANLLRPHSHPQAE